MRSRTGRLGQLAALVAIGAVVASVPAWGAGSAERRPRPLVVAAGGNEVTASQGSYCVFQHRRGYCADTIYPLPVKGLLPVAPGERVVLRTGDRAIRRARVSLVHATRDNFQALDWSTTARRVQGHPRTLTLRLPGHLGHANRLDISVTYTHHRGDSEWWAGIEMPVPV